MKIEQVQSLTVLIVVHLFHPILNLYVECGQAEGTGRGKTAYTQ